MFDLEQEIARWRKAMAKRRPFHREDVDELESHLRDAVRAQMQSGVAPELAWTEALKQLGDLDAIAAEYRKLPRHSVWRWWPARIVVGAWAVINLWIGWMLLSRLVAGRGDILLYFHTIAITQGYTAVFSLGGLAAWSIFSRAWVGWSTPQREVFGLATRRATTAALVLTVTGLITGTLWCKLHHGYFWSWDPREIGAVAMVAWQVLVLWVIARGKDERLSMLLGLTGSLVVALCWIGAQFLRDNIDITRFPLMIGAFSAVLVTLFVLAFQPAGCLRFRRAI